jgi:hypothetical protein
MVGKRTYLFGTILCVTGLILADDALMKMCFIGVASFLAVAYTFNKDRE